MTPDTFYKIFITSLLKGIVIYYIAYYEPTKKNSYHFGTKGDNKIIITAMSNCLHKIRIYHDKTKEEERVRVAKYDS